MVESASSLNVLVLSRLCPRLPTYAISITACEPTGRWILIENWSTCGISKCEFTKLNELPTNVIRPWLLSIGWLITGKGLLNRSGNAVLLESGETFKAVLALYPTFWR